MKKVHYGWFIVLACCAITCCTGIVNTSGGNFYRPVCAELGIGLGTLTLYVTIMSLTMAFMFPTAGKFLAKNLKPVLLLGGILQYVAFGLMSTFYNVYQFYIAGFIIGLGSSITMFMAVPILINMWFVEKKGTAMGIALACSGLSGAIFSPITGWVIASFGWRIAYIICASCGLLIYLPAILFLVKTPAEKGLKPYGYREDTTQETVDINITSVTIVQGMDFKDAIKSPQMYLMFLLSMTLAAASAQATQVSAYATGHYGFSTTLAATVVSAFALGGVAGKLALGAIDDRIGHIKTLVFGAILAIVGQVILLFNTSATMVIMATFLAGTGLAIYGILPPLMTGDIFGLKDYNRIWAYVMSAGCIAGAVATPAYGTIYDATGSYSSVFIVIAALTLIGTVSGVLVKKCAC